MKKKPFLIAEISANHCGDFILAKKLITCAKINGADAVKLQTFTADTMTLKSNKTFFKIKSGLWKGYRLWDLYNKARTPLEWHPKLFKYAKSIGIKIFSTPFDVTAVDFLEKLNCPIYKVASFEMTDLNLVRKIAKTNKPMIISTGMASLDEIKETYQVAKRNGSGDITLLYCVSNYPSSLNDFSLNNIKILKEKFNCKVGLSDHSKDNRVAISSIAYGAEVVEKHIALDNGIETADSFFSLKPKEFSIMVENIRKTEIAIGNVNYDIPDEVKSDMRGRRSLYFTKPMNCGEIITREHIKSVRPAWGLHPKFYEQLIGKEIKRKVDKGDRVISSDLNSNE